MAEFDDIVCENCGIHFGLNEERVKALRKTHNNFYCPNGHSLSYKGKSTMEEELDALKVEVKDLREKLEAAQAEIELQTKKATELSMELEIFGLRPSSNDKASTTPVERGKGTTTGLIT